MNDLSQNKTDFLSMTVHQLRTPLVLMRWKLERLFRDQAFKNWAKQSKKELRQIHRFNLHTLKLVSYLLDITRLEQGKHTEQPTLINVVRVTGEIIKKFRVEVEKKQIVVKFKKSSKKIPKLLIHRFYFREIIDNLISNAIKYNREKGKITIAIDKTEKTIRISITDTGIGITKKDQPKIFSKFFRAPYAQKKEQYGTGLGLYIVKLYVEACHGRIWFESKFRKGSTFYLEFPLS